MKKSTVEEIKHRFDNDVERFSNLDTGQEATVDATLSLELLCETAKCLNPKAIDLLDLGCGAGNYTLKMLTKLPDLNCYLVDLSKPMLDRAFTRVRKRTIGKVKTFQDDLRHVNFGNKRFDIIVAGAVLHHLREDPDWERTFQKIYHLLKPGGTFMIADLVSQEEEALSDYMWLRYSQYLEKIGGLDYRKKVLAYIEKEDSPRSLSFQLELMKRVGFRKTEVLHKNICFAAFAGIK